ncbi:antiterminator [Escherichia coli]|uniref:bacteriophage antitermination protein Q n=1 Tax=Escherichia coli TaxID=562 RepID=UPI0018019FD5|nr:bacteriophage antitermination protein Q [Escherichia coli]EFB8890927.1 antiterminator [Escherichia coli]EFO2698917.1 antiterminator [Escherichia coli]EFO2712141.1 antiterminator [Escherichia coli]EKI8165939.1 antiterminator [Escherichia coli]MBW4310564.1 bacteriophage antitermination protein Q [Escherichia coli]
MNSQQLEYVRQQLIVATADLSGATKGQLVAFAENAQFTATARSRGRKKVYDAQKKRMVNPDGPPMSGSQSRAKGSSIALVSPVEFGTASWRRAVLSLEDHQRAWLLWTYSDNICWELQETIVRWAWEQFNQQFAGVRIAKKTVDRLRQLIWLAAQNVKAELAGRDVYQYGDLAALVGVNKTNWSQNYVEHYNVIISLYKGLDSKALLHVSRSRSQQKAANYQQGIAKMN